MQRPNLKEDTKQEAEAAVSILEKLPKPEPPNIKGKGVVIYVLQSKMFNLSGVTLSIIFHHCL